MVEGEVGVKDRGRNGVRGTRKYIYHILVGVHVRSWTEERAMEVVE